MLPTPNLDDRTFEQIRDEAIRLIPQYCPEWTNYNPSDPGITLIELFSWMTEMVLYRLNKVPDKVYLTLLDLIGVRLRPPTPSRAMLTFHLVEGYQGGAWVPRGSQIATEQTEQGEAIVFETEEDLFVSPVKLVRSFSIERDRVSDNTEALKTIPRKPFLAFGGANTIERFLYLGDPRFSTLKETGTVQLVFDCPQAKTEGITALLEWEYWNGHRWRDLDPVPVPKEELASSSETQRVVAFAGPLQDLAPGEVNGEEGFWLRGRLIELPVSPVETVIDTITATASILTEGVYPEKTWALVTGEVYVPLDVTKTFYPFGEQPQRDACWYILSAECFGKDDARNFIDVRLADPTQIPAPGPTKDLQIHFEYWNGRRWAELGRTTPEGAPGEQANDFRDGTNAFSKNGTISFVRPKDFVIPTVNGEEGPWIRVRIGRGDYGRPGRYEVQDGNYVWRDDQPLRPPAFAEVSLRYSQVPYALTRCITYNDFNYIDRTGNMKEQFRTFQAFEPFKEESPAFYLGFDRAFPSSTSKIWFRIEEEGEQDQQDTVLDEPFPEEASERVKRARKRKQDQRLVWEYWQGDQWKDLLPKDGTQNLTRSGTLEFKGPADFRSKREFGEDLFWVRARLEMGSYARAPRIEDVLPNSVAAVNAMTVEREILGHSDGTPDQRFTFSRFPVLPGERLLVRENEVPGKRELKRVNEEEGEDALTVVKDEAGNPKEIWVRWHRVESFYGSSSTDRHYLVDPVVGKVIFGDGRRGMIPPAGSNSIVADRYLTGGGVVGNVGAGSIVTLRHSIPYIERATNYYKATGGCDLETIDEAKMRGPQVIRHRYRAVTTEDYEYLALKASGNVARAKCLKMPRREGEVTVLVVPRSEETVVDVKKKLVPTPELIRRVKDFLDERRLVTTKLRVAKPKFVEISLKCSVVLKPIGALVDRVKRELEDAIRRALHPTLGGTDGSGWPFGRALHKSDLFRVVEGIEGVDYIEELEIIDMDHKRTTVQVALREDELIHVVDVEVREVAKERMA
ncbi:putative baseplate assembly protein [bacterium]|nr:putative baseplate assembly protein [bacterium]